jgi:hypothetical protein
MKPFSVNGHGGSGATKRNQSLRAETPPIEEAGSGNAFRRTSRRVWWPSPCIAQTRLICFHVPHARARRVHSHVVRVVRSKQVNRGRSVASRESHRSKSVVNLCGQFVRLGRDDGVADEPTTVRLLPCVPQPWLSRSFCHRRMRPDWKCLATGSILGLEHSRHHACAYYRDAGRLVSSGSNGGSAVSPEQRSRTACSLQYSSRERSPLETGARSSERLRAL